MPLRIPPFQSGYSLVDSSGMAVPAFHVWWQQVIRSIEDAFNTQQSTIDRIKRMLSHTSPTTILSAGDDGTSATMTVLNHNRVYGDGTVLAVTGGATPSLLSDTVYAGYYDDTTLADTTPTFHFTTVVETAQAATAEGRHFLGILKTPSAGSGQTRDGGGVYPAGSSVGGEV